MLIGTTEMLIATTPRPYIYPGIRTPKVLTWRNMGLISLDIIRKKYCQKTDINIVKKLTLIELNGLNWNNWYFLIKIRYTHFYFIRTTFCGMRVHFLYLFP